MAERGRENPYSAVWEIYLLAPVQSLKGSANKSKRPMKQNKQVVRAIRICVQQRRDGLLVKKL